MEVTYTSPVHEPSRDEQVFFCGISMSKMSRQTKWYSGSTSMNQQFVHTSLLVVSSILNTVVKWCSQTWTRYQSRNSTSIHLSEMFQYTCSMDVLQYATYELCRGRDLTWISLLRGFLAFLGNFGFGCLRDLFFIIIMFLLLGGFSLAHFFACF